MQGITGFRCFERAAHQAVLYQQDLGARVNGGLLGKGHAAPAWPVAGCSARLTSLRGGRGAHLVFGERAESGCVGDQATVGEMGCGAQSAAGGVICINSTVAKATGGRTSEQAKALQSARGAAAVLYARRELDRARYAVRVARVTVRTHHLSITH